MPPQSFREDIEGLRAVAILLVVAYHAGVPGVSGGYVGVDAFFVLSGFLITGLLTRELATSGRVNFFEFYARRARRLLPAAGCVLLATLLVGYWLLPPVEQLRYTGTAMATALYVSNLWFAKEATNYLAPDSHRNPFLHTWSLSVEEQFYFVWPLLLFLVWRASHHGERSLARMMLVVAVGGAVTCAWMTGVHQPTAFFGSPFRAWEFAAGGMASLWVPPVRVRQVLPWISAIAIGIAAYRYDDVTLFPGTAAIAPVMATVGLLWAPRESVLARLLSTTPLQYIGRLSYSWYLWHWPVLLFGVAAAPVDTLSLRLALAALALALSALTYVFVENPLRRAPALVKFPKRSLVLTVSLTALLATTALSARTVARMAAAEGRQQEFAHAVDDVPAVYARGCHLAREATTPVPCEFGDATSPAMIVLFGDSHAAQWLPALEPFGAARRVRIVTLTKSACPAASVEPLDRVLNRGYRECLVWRQAALDWIEAHHPAAVVISSASSYMSPGGGGLTVRQWADGLAETMGSLTEAGIPVLSIRDTPAPGFDVPTCLARADWNPLVFGRGCGFARSGTLSDEIFAAESAVVRRTARSAVLDLTDGICGSNRFSCDTISKGTVIFRDGDHLTTRFASTLAPAVDTALSELMVFGRTDLTMR